MLSLVYPREMQLVNKFNENMKTTDSHAKRDRRAPNVGLTMSNDSRVAIVGHNFWLPLSGASIIIYAKG